MPGRPPEKIRPVGHGVSLTHGWLVALIVARLSDSIKPSLTGRIFFARFQALKYLATII